MIVIACSVLVLGIVGAIAKILVGVFRINLEAVVVYFFLIRSLNKDETEICAFNRCQIND